jgi:hypothetical protein
MFSERRLKNSPYPMGIRFLHHLATQQIATGRVADGQWINALSVQRPEPPLEVSTPYLIRLRDVLKRLRIRRRLPPLSPRYR